MFSNLTVILFFMIPTIAGFLGILLPAFGWFPIYGSSEVTFEFLLQLASQPGFLRSSWLTIFTALGSTFIAYWISIFTLIFSQKVSCYPIIKKIIAPLISVPHITIAIGILFLIQPSGWISRIFSPWLTGWQNPPDLSIAPDLYGFSLILGLVVKELPFLLLVGFSIIKQTNFTQYRKQILSLGYGPISGWFHVIHPFIAKRMRLSVLIVLCFTISVVDMALILAPSSPSPLAIKIFSWNQSPDIKSQLLAASCSIYLIMLTLLCCLTWILFGKTFEICFRRLSYQGIRLHGYKFLRKSFIFLVLGLLTIFLGIGILSVVSAGIWSFVSTWQYPSALPQKFGFYEGKIGFNTYIEPFINTFIIGISSSTLAMTSAIIWLEFPSKFNFKLLEVFLYLPLLLPQTGFLFGIQIFLIWFGLDGMFMTIIWAHYLFVFPYILLILGPTWRRIDIRYEMLGASFKFNKIQRLIRIKIPLMLMPIFTSLAIGFSVSSALYLPTIFASNGNFLTLTTEAVVLALNGSRQAVGIAALLQIGLPLVMFILAGIFVRIKTRNFSYFKIAKG